MKSSKHMSVSGWVARVVLLGTLASPFGLAACGDDEVTPGDTSDTVSPIEDVDTIEDTEDTANTVDTSEDIEIRYPGNLCDEDQQCATGLCYGNATSQGFFEPTKCQTKCLDLFNYNRYCDSNSDCCKGKCCLGCGGQEGLCIL